MSQKRFTLLISLIICQIVFLNVFVFGESETKTEGKLDERTSVIFVLYPLASRPYRSWTPVRFECPHKPNTLAWLNETSFSLIP